MEKDDTRVLRIITIVSLVPAINLSLASISLGGGIFPALGLIPQTFSAVFGLFCLMKLVQSRPLRITIDVIVAALCLAFLIASWIHIRQTWSHSWSTRFTSRVMVGTYGTVPLMLAFVLHVWLVIREIPFNFPSVGVCAYCRHCQRDDLTVIRPGIKISSNSYRPLAERADYDEGDRPLADQADYNDEDEAAVETSVKKSVDRLA